MTYDTHNVNKELTKWHDLRKVLEGENLDEKCLFDTLDGETELVEALCCVKETVLEDQVILEALEAHIEQLTRRKHRISKGIETKNNIILSVMVTADISTIKGPLFTMTKARTTPKLVITNESEIPTKYWKAKDPVVDKTELLKALKAKEAITGATLSNGGVSLKTRIL